MKWKCRVSKHSERVTRAAWCFVAQQLAKAGGNIRHSPLKFKQQHQRLFLVPCSLFPSPADDYGRQLRLRDEDDYADDDRPFEYRVADG